MSERILQKNIIKVLCTRRDCRIFTNDSGLAYRPKPGTKFNVKNFNPIHYGLVKGGSDIIGWKTTTITEDMVGKRIAVFLALEVKRPGKRMNVTEHQKYFLDAVEKAGGIAGVVTSVKHSEDILNEYTP